MTKDELIEVFFSKAYEDMINEKILDDKMFVIPVSRIKEYVLNVISLPYSEYLYSLISEKIPEITSSDITQCSSFSACEIEMCENLIEEDNPGFGFVDIGLLFPEYCKSSDVRTLRKYGENQIKTSRQLGLAFEYYGLWYLNCIGYVYPSLTLKQRSALLARTILRDPLYGHLIRDMLDGDVSLTDYMGTLKNSTIIRRGSSIKRILNYAVIEAQAENLKLGECNFTKPIRVKSEYGQTLSKSEEATYLFTKKIDKSFVRLGMTLPIKCIDRLKSLLNFDLEKGESFPIKIEFNGSCYSGRITRVNMKNHDRICYQMFWNRQSALSADLQLYYGAPSEVADNLLKDREEMDVYVNHLKCTVILVPKERATYQLNLEIL